MDGKVGREMGQKLTCRPHFVSQLDVNWSDILLKQQSNYINVLSQLVWFEQNIKATQITPQLGNGSQFDHLLAITSLMYACILIL